MQEQLVKYKGCGIYKIGIYKINHDEFKSEGTHWIALYADDDIVIYFNSFGVVHGW